MVSINDLLPPPRVQEAPQAARVARPPPQTLASRRQALSLARPSSGEREEQLQRTQAALDALVAQRNGARDAAPPRAAIAYTARGDARARTLRVVEQQNDPLEPPRHRYRKEHTVAPVTPQTAAAIQRQEPALSAAEKQEWAVPASVSNWKNPRGYIIDLDRRAAADKSVAPAASAKHGGLAAALAAADEDFRAEQEARRRAEEDAASQHSEQQRLKLRLLAQKTQAASAKRSSDASADLFDTRLFHASKRRHDTYDQPLFVAQSAAAKRGARGAGGDDLSGLKPVEFERE